MRTPRFASRSPTPASAFPPKRYREYSIVLVYSISPESTEEARIEKRSGNVLVNLWVDTNGNPSHVHTLRGVGLGLDEKAVEAVKQYKFKPALKNGEPVLVEINVEVNFTNRLILIPVASHSSVFR
jgi:TonB family protein